MLGVGVEMAVGVGDGGEEEDDDDEIMFERDVISSVLYSINIQQKPNLALALAPAPSLPHSMLAKHLWLRHPFPSHQPPGPIVFSLVAISQHCPPPALYFVHAGPLDRGNASGRERASRGG